MRAEARATQATNSSRASYARGNLTDKAVQAARPESRPYKVAAGGGLYLLITPAGSKLWRWKYRSEGREKLMSFGAYPDVSLAQARQQRDAAKVQLRERGDPMEMRRKEKLARMVALENSFEAVARKWWADWHGARSKRHADYVLRRLEQDVFPVIGARPIAEIAAPELVRMAKGIEARGALDIAKRALQTTSQIFRYAIGHGVASRNPATDIRPSDVLKSRKQTNYARIEERELPALLRAIEGYQGTPITRLAMKLLALTFVRTTELIGARWDEIDLNAAQWKVPASRMKMKTEHIVPLAPQAVQILRVLYPLTGTADLLFPGERDRTKPISNNTILAAIDRMGFKGRMTGHGFRGLASTILHEHGHEHEHIELQLAHAPRNRVSAAYNHARHLAARRALMCWWADYLDVARGRE
jgi:integrase